MLQSALFKVDVSTVVIVPKRRHRKTQQTKAKMRRNNNSPFLSLCILSALLFALCSLKTSRRLLSITHTSIGNEKNGGTGGENAREESSVPYLS
jgi:hypothetical protein